MTNEERPQTLRRPRPSALETVDPIDSVDPTAVLASKPPVVAPAPTAAPAPVAAENAANQETSTVGEQSSNSDAPVNTKLANLASPSFSAVEELKTTGFPERPETTKEVIPVVQVNSKISVHARMALKEMDAFHNRTIRSSIEKGIYILQYLSQCEREDTAPSMAKIIEIYSAE